VTSQFERQELLVELTELCRQQSEAFKQAVYLSMSVDESRKFDERCDRIAKIHRLLEEKQTA
jgi:hypothetical protein